MQFDCNQPVQGHSGLVFDERVREQADGLLGLYYTDDLQFLPNPFTANAIEAICSLFPATLEPRTTWRARPE